MWTHLQLHRLLPSNWDEMKERKLENYHTAYKYIPKERLQAVLGLQIIANELQVRLVIG